jgi:cytidylate kinase
MGRLKDRQDTLRLFLFSTTEDKVRRLISRGKSEAEALELVDTVDRDRIDFIQKYFHVEWPTRYLYHLMLNTAIGEETVVQTILNFMKTLDAKSSTSWSKGLP